MVQAPLLSFYSKAFYQDVAEHWRSEAPLFLVILLSLCWVPLMFDLFGNWSRFMEEEAPPLLEQMPTISILNGVVTANPAGPTYLTDHTTGRVFAIVDTTGTVESLAHTDATLLLTRNQLITKKDAETTTYDLANVKEFSLNRHRLEGWLHIAKTWVPPGLYVLLVFLSGVYRFLEALLCGAAGLWFAKRRNIAMGYWAAVRLSMMSLCPTILLQTALETAGLTFKFSGLILFVIALSYLWFGIGACRKEETGAGIAGT
jgi:uncharacterized protein DUF1189